MCLVLADGSPFTWWVGRSGEAHMYWGGAVPGSQQCACGLQDNCVNPEHFCNCDADSKEWYCTLYITQHVYFVCIPFHNIDT